MTDNELGDRMTLDRPDDDEPRFNSCNIFALPLTEEIAHGGVGTIRAKRFVTKESISGGCNFIDYVEVPPGTSIGEHRHTDDEEEFYLVLAGRGEMRVENQLLPVKTGDLVRNSPGGLHGLTNIGDEVIRLFIFELSTTTGNLK